MNQFPIKQIKNIGFLLWFSMVTFLIIYLFIAHFYGSNGTEYFDHFGSFIGGIFGTLLSFISVILVIYTIRQQQIDQEKQQIEARFFELLKIHRENVKEMAKSSVEGRVIFVHLWSEFFSLFNLIRKINNELKLNYPQKDLINIAYIGLFFGSIKPMRSTFKNWTSQYNETFLLNIVEQSSISSMSFKEGYIYFDGHQVRLSQYFRHLFQLVNYIDDKSLLTFTEKYQYIKLLRAQLSNQEQVILAFNVLSNIGSIWENDQSEENKKLITKYNLIKNIPEGFTQSINLKTYFPKVTFEGEEKTQERIDLEKSYY